MQFNMAREELLAASPWRGARFRARRRRTSSRPSSLDRDLARSVGARRTREWPAEGVTR
jgi:hypothetical protein